ncbi:hypothetical protein AB0I52_19445 [Streptomyces sp. NPDC050423]|uniref:DUF3885 domain-containing protein n=1 Tax=Streptomyces sp. NPDC050423 TaxID=3155402 RepID=UPI0034393576
MGSPAGRVLPDLDREWTARWGETLPVGHFLPGACPDRWVRFHSLPESRRYATDEDEYEILLGRHHTLLAGLGAPRELIAITCGWSGDPSPAGREPDLERVAPGEHWQTVLEDPAEEPEYRVYTHLYAGVLANRRASLDPLLREIADDGTAGVILAPRSLRWLVHPYDGGIDVITATPAERDALRSDHADWLSAHPGGR